MNAHHQSLRLEVLRLILERFGAKEGALDLAAQAMHLVEHGPTIEEEADSDDEPSIVTPAPPEPAPAGIRRAGDHVHVTATSPMTRHDKPAAQALAEAIIATNAAAHAEAAAPPAAKIGGPPPKIDEAAAREMFDAGATFAEIGARFGVSTSGARKFAERRGWPQRRPRTPAPEPTDTAQATPEPVVRQWCARWLPAQRLSDPITEAEMARVDAERRRRGLTPFTRIKEIA